MLSEAPTIAAEAAEIMTPLEKRLARRIHNQRRRLRQMEEFAGWQREARSFNHSKWLYLASRALKENRELRAKLGIVGNFDQIAALRSGEQQRGNQ